MSIIETFKETGIFVKISSSSLLVSLLFVWIAFTCTGWGGYDRKEVPSVKNGLHFGLWRICDDSIIVTPCKPLDGVTNEWFGTVQAFVTFGFLGINVAFFLLILYVFVPSCQRNGEVGKAASIICFVTAGFYFIGVIIFGVRYKRDYIEQYEQNFKFGYCYFLSIAAILFEGGAGVLLFLDARMNGTQTPTERQNLTVSTASSYQGNPTYGASENRDTVE